MTQGIICIICLILAAAAFGALLRSLPDAEKDERKTIIGYSVLNLAVIVIDCIAITNITMTESLRKYDEGKIEKVVKYRSESVNGKTTKIDSTYTYRVVRK
jgi:hypothetical protein